MLLIVMHHFAIYSGFEFSQKITINKLIVQFLTIGGKIGVDIFVLITGYFMINSKIKGKKILRLIAQVFMYSIFFLLINIKRTDIKNIIISIFPTTHVMYWFITNYVILYILSPFINKFIEMINEKELRKLLILLIIIQSIIPSISFSQFQFSNLMWFITLYMIGSYVSKFYKPKPISIKKNLITTIITYLLMMLSVIILDLLSTKIALFKGKEVYYANMNSILVLINSISIFLLFKNINLGKNNIINKISGTTLGIYIIHENVFMRDIIWRKIFKGSYYINSGYLILYAFFAIISVFIVCSMIELMRQKLIEPFQNKLIEKIYEKGKKLKKYLIKGGFI